MASAQDAAIMIHQTIIAAAVLASTCCAIHSPVFSSKGAIFSCCKREAAPTTAAGKPNSGSMDKNLSLIHILCFLVRRFCRRQACSQQYFSIYQFAPPASISIRKNIVFILTDKPRKCNTFIQKISSFSRGKITGENDRAKAAAAWRSTRYI